MSQLVRPGGRILVQELVFGEIAERSISEPAFPARTRRQRLLWAAMQHAGASPSIATADELRALIAEYEAAQSLSFNYWSGHLTSELVFQFNHR